jgi:hypothetical protein
MGQNDFAKISTDEMTETLGRSGYLIESRLETVLKDAGYYVESNSAYPDPETDKSREVDLIAFRSLDPKPPGDRYDSFSALLTIECVNNPQPLAFITKEPRNRLYEEEFPVTGIPLMVDEGASYKHVADLLEVQNYHHYFRGRIATQYCSFTKKKGSSDKRWMAHHNEEQHNSFATLTKIFDWEKTTDPIKFGVGIRLTFNYLVLAVQGKLVEVQASCALCDISDADHIQYRRFSASGGESQTYLIDVVTETFFPQYLSIVDTELQQAAKLIAQHRTILSEGVDRAVRMKQPIPKSGL